MTAIADLPTDLEEVEDDSEVDEGSSESDALETYSAPAARTRRRMSAQRRIALFCLAAVVALGGVAGWWGYRLHHGQQVQAQRSQFLQVARQGALNLTTIDWHHADADVRRILDGATGEFYNDFSRRSQPFVEVLAQAKATTVGTITEAGVESETPEGAQVLVAVSVQTSNAGEPDPVPRAWRMRISVQRVGGQIKVSNVGFVS